MKLRILLSFVSAICLLHCTSMDLSGKKYYGRPLKSGPKPGFEGAAQAGQISFTQERVTFILPGSDEKNAGTYTVAADSVVIKDLSGKTHTFTVKDGGKVLQKGEEEFRRADYPWQ